MDTLSTLRKEIDNIDKALLQLIAKRTAIASEIGQLKKGESIPVTDSEREDQILSSVSKEARIHGLDQDIIKNIWRLLFSHAKNVERKI